MGWTEEHLGINLSPVRLIADVGKTIGKVITSVIKDPIPALLQIGGSMIGIPPYVTASAITAARGGDIGDIAKSAAVSYITTDFLQNTQIGTDIRNYTSNMIAGDVTDFMIENFDISTDAAVTVAKMSTAALNGALVGGIRSTLLGQDISDAITSGFTQGLVYSGVDSYFDDLNKDPNWGFSPKALNLMKGATSTALNTIISGNGDPAAALGNYIAYAGLKLGASEAKTAFQRAYEDFTGKTDQAREAQSAFINVKAEFDTEARKHDLLAEQIRSEAQQYENIYNNEVAPIKQQLDAYQQELYFQHTLYYSAKDQFENNKWAFENYDQHMENTGHVRAGVEADGSIIWAKETGEKPLIDIYGFGGGPPSNLTFDVATKDSFAAAANSAAAEANKYAALAEEVANKYNELANQDSVKSAVDRMESLKTSINNNSDQLRAIRANIETPQNGNLAERLKVAADRYDQKYNLYKSSEEAKNRAAENYNKIIADVVVRDATIDAINMGAITVSGRTEDGGFQLDNGMVFKDGKFSQNGQPLFTNAAGLLQNNLELVDQGGYIYRYGMDAGRQMSSSDVQRAFERDYGVKVSDEEARRFVGTGYGFYDVNKFDEFAKKKLEQTYQIIAGEKPSQEQLQEFVQKPNSQQVASNAAVVASSKDTTMQNNTAALKLREDAVNKVLDSYDAQGLTAEQIDEKISSGEATREIQSILEQDKQRVEQSRQAARDAQETYGKDSQEYKDAYRKSLEDMANHGEYNITKNSDGSFTHSELGTINPETLVSSGSSDFYVDPVTGRQTLRMSLGLDSEPVKIKDISALWAIGKSGNPPTTGGVSLFGDGSGTQGGIPGPTLIAIDDGVGDKNAKMFDLGNGFALIAYSDGKNKIVKEDGTVFFVDAAEAQELFKNSQVTTPATVAVDGGKKQEATGEKTLGTFTETLTDPNIAQKIVPAAEAPVTNIKAAEDVKQVTPPEKIAPEVPPITPPKTPAETEKPSEQVKPEEAQSIVAPPAVPKPSDTPTSPSQPSDTTTATGTTATQTTPTPSAQQPVVDTSKIESQVTNVESKLTQAIEQAKQAGLQGDAALQAGIDKVAADLNTTKDVVLEQVGKTEQQLRTDFSAQLGGVQTQIGNVETRLKDAMAANEAAGLSRDQAAAKAIEDVAASVGSTKADLLSQLGKTEETIRGELAAGLQATQEQLSQQMQAQYQQLSEAQKAEVDARVKQGQDLTTAITAVGAQTASQLAQTETALREAIGQLGTDVQGQFDQMSEAQKAEVAARVQQGQDLSAAIQNVGQQAAQQLAQTEAGLQAAIGQLGTNVQQQFSQMDAAQKAEVAARVQQGQDLQTAIQNVGQQISQQIAQSEQGLREAIGQLGTDVQGRFDQMTEAQKAEVAARVQQGQDLRGAIDNVGQQTTQQIAASEAAMREALGKLGTDVQTQFGQLSDAQKAEVAARVQQGQDLNAAIQNVGQQTAAQIAQTQTALRGEIGKLGEDVQAQFNQMSEAQQAEVAARVQQGQTLDTAIKSVSTQLTEVGEKLTTDVQDIKKSIADENARRAAAEKAAAGKAQQEQLLQKAAQNIAVPGAGGATGDGAPTPSPQMRSALTTGEAPQAKFEGPLEEFMKRVEQTSYTQPAGQPMQQPQQTQQPTAQQPTQVAQQGPNYYSYGVFNEIDSILNPLQNMMPSMFAKEGGLAVPLMAKGGLNVVHHSGKERLDFRQGAAVSGPGDGQSDDIPAMLADGEFVFPADVVAALGNGSTKAGSDKLYDMMHSIRAYHRSAKPQDLPPPAKKSPLDYLKKARR